MRLCLIQITDIPEQYEEATLAMCRPSFEKVLRADTEVGMRATVGGAKPGNPQDFDNPYFAFLGTGPIIEAIIQAERDGYDAAWVNCFGEPGVAEARAVVDMPVIGAAEATLHFACQIGRRFALVVPNMPGQIAQGEETVRSHGLEGRLIPRGVRTDREPFPELWEKGQKNPQVVADSVAEVGRGCVADGADVIVVGCCGSGPLCSTAGFNNLEVDGQEVPVLDPTMVAAKMAETAADIRNGTGLPIPARTRNQVLPSAEDWARIRARFGLEG